MAVDYFGRDAACVKNKRLFLFDMDGTIYKENILFDGTHELLKEIERIGGRYVFITNNSSKSVSDYIAKVNYLGIKADESNFFTSGQASILLLKEKHPNERVYCQGTISLVNELKESGINVTEDTEHVDIVLVGFDTELTSAKLIKTCMLLNQNLPYYATNPDLRCPVSFGYVPDCGSICGMIENCTGKTPVYIGKPEPIMVHMVREKYGFSLAETCVIGDRLYTDIATAINAGVTGICVLTGEATIEEINTGNIRPQLTFESVKEIYKAIK